MSARFALVTPSYRGDFERCRLLCESIDSLVTGFGAHYLLVDERDVAMFRPLAGPRRHVISERQLFPGWLASWPDPMTWGRRRVWTGPGALMRGVGVLRGWHMQQLLKMALPSLIDEEVLLYADSDIMFLRPFDVRSLESGGRIKLYRKPGGIGAEMTEHRGWLDHAAGALGVPKPEPPADDYINGLVSWSRANALAMLDRIERTTSRHWIAAVTAGRSFSEWTIYGLHADRVLGEASGHFHDPQPLARTFWFSRDVNPDSFTADETLLEKGQVALGVQSFIDVPVETLRGVFRRSAAAA
jgi:hypothetical protein